MKSTIKIIIRLSVYLIIYAFLLLSIKSAYPQGITQVVKGKVFDKESESPLEFATVVVLGTSPQLGVNTDAQGSFKIAGVPIGRYNIQVTFIGYEPTVIPEILITSGKEVVLNIGLVQSLNQIEEIKIQAYSRKDRPVNSMASISARSFTVEETRRYAGGLDDPARMVSAFAGVTVGNLQDNAIIIRGNSPKGVSWRLEGVEIPNPNHFPGGNVAGGGVVTVFSSQLLSNSDFYTGAFPAEYGNALAGVFDMKLRNGNYEKRESTFQAGLLGLDFASEGPFKKGGTSSYLFNYRYSTFSLLTKMGILPSDETPQYQDLSFKLNFPTKRAGVFSVWGIGAMDLVHEPGNADSTKWQYDWDRITFDWNLSMGAIGVSHKLMLGSATYINTTIVASGSTNKMDSKRFDNSMVPRPNWYFVDKSARISLNTFINHKFSPKHTLKTGVNYSKLLYNLDLNSTINDVPETFQNYVKQDGTGNLVEFYAQSRYNILSNLTLNSGVNFSYFDLNKDYSIDPRLSLKWDFATKQSLSFGYGQHSQLEELKIYLIKHTANGKDYYPNKDLKFSHAQHLVLSYDWLINKSLRLKVEPYFQYLYNIPGIPDSSYSMINFKQDWAFRDSLANNSVGRNYGVDITLERFLNRNYYYLFTASIFSSKYKGDDDVWRSTRYNKGYAVNVLVGKEFFLSRNRILGVNARLNYMGGERLSPVLYAQSLQRKDVVYDDSRAFEDQNQPMYNLDITITYRANKKRYSGVWALQIKNVLGSPMDDGYSYNYRTKKIESDQTVIILPVLSYKVEF
ncbi:MAG: TonB-dependent receptor [Bacteroidales bacterium]|nr:MAG: TonB-dependent receptor [Bacteroidales bacterium]